MKIRIAGILVCLLLATLCLTGCTKGQAEPGIDPAHAEAVEQAIEVLKAHWEQSYAETSDFTNGYLEIKNTRIIKIKDEPTTPDGDSTNTTLISQFGNVEYVVEFMLYSDYFGSSAFGDKPYYTNISLDDAVVIYKDGSAEVRRQTPFEIYRSRTYSLDYSGIIEDIADLGSAYNAVYNLN